MKPFYLKAPCKDYIWGGSRLRDYGKQSDRDVIAESWELSCHPDGESVIASGSYAGLTLPDYLKEHPEALGTACGRFDRFPVLIKLIDAHDDLSVQVHPDDAYAQRVEHEYGKTELWYVVDARPGAELIYGVRESVTKEQLRQAIADGTLGTLLNRIPVKPGDSLYIPAGTLHAIGKGVLIAEVQQSSNITYRVYDYDRPGRDGKPRELHIDKALDVVRLTPLTPTEAYRAEEPVSFGNFTIQRIGSCDYFSVNKVDVRSLVNFDTDAESFNHILVLEGEAVLRTQDGDRMPMRPGTSIFVPAGYGRYWIEGECRLLLTDICAE